MNPYHKHQIDIMHTLLINNLTKSYKQKTIVKNVSLKIAQGEIVGLLGPNGSGKTTSFYMIAGLISCDKGQIILNDIDISQASIHGRACLGLSYLPQEASIFRKLTVADNIMAILELRNNLTTTAREDRLAQLLREFHIEHLSDTLGLKLSGGERRRVEIARCLATEPKYILLDEPFAGIDPIAIMGVKKLIQHLRQHNIGVLITDHNVKATLDICDHAYILNHGQILCDGTTTDILNNQDVRDFYLGTEFSL
jgi:lipopolysaccharide export system ATP-binding protein